jgi:hypothetical protein
MSSSLVKAFHSIVLQSISKKYIWLFDRFLSIKISF